MTNLLDLAPGALSGYFADRGEKPFHARQVSRWIHQRFVADFGAMSDLPRALRERLAFTVMLLIARRFVSGEAPWRQRAMAEHLEIPGSALAMVVDSLEKAGLVTLNEDEDMLPARDLEGIALADVLSAVRDERQFETWLLWRARTEPVADAVADTVESAVRERIGDMTLRELASREAS